LRNTGEERDRSQCQVTSVKVSRGEIQEKRRRVSSDKCQVSRCQGVKKYERRSVTGREDTKSVIQI
jgi:hypothetical protein